MPPLALCFAGCWRAQEGPGSRRLAEFFEVSTKAFAPVG
jgi:hypothetical protein